MYNLDKEFSKRFGRRFDGISATGTCEPEDKVLTQRILRYIKKRIKISQIAILKQICEEYTMNQIWDGAIQDLISELEKK